MKLGDFFKSATHACPVNPKPITFTCSTNAETLPDGSKNPPGRIVRATATAAFIFLNADEVLDARAAARRALRDRAEKALDEGELPDPIDPGDLDIEVIYQLLQRALREWDPEAKKVGEPFFPTVEAARELLVLREANRVYAKWNEYISEEHPEGSPSQATFRGPKARGGRVAR